MPVSNPRFVLQPGPRPRARRRCCARWRRRSIIWSALMSTAVSCARLGANQDASVARVVAAFDVLISLGRSAPGRTKPRVRSCCPSFRACCKLLAQSAHPADPSIVVFGFLAHIACDLRMRQDEEALLCNGLRRRARNLLGG